jgi:hypothetical protein
LDTSKTVHKTKKVIYDRLIFEARQNTDFINTKYFNNVSVICDILKVTLLYHFDEEQKHNAQYIHDKYIPEHIVFVKEILKYIPTVHGIAIYFHPSLYNEPLLEIPKIHLHRINDVLKPVIKATPITIADKKWFKNSFETRTPTWSKPIVIYGERVLAYYLPVFIKDKPFALIAMYVGYEYIDSFINRFILQTTGYAYILNEDLVLLSHPHMKYFINLRLDNLIPKLREMLKENKTYGVIEYDFQNVHKLAVWNRMQNGDFFVLVGNTSELLKEIEEITWVSRIVAMLFVCITLVVLYIVCLSLKK